MQNSVTGRKLLIIEDDSGTYLPLSEHFRAKGNDVKIAVNVSQALAFLKSDKFDAVVLDLLLADGDGMDILSLKSYLPPTIILSTLADEDKILEGLSSGAVDYIVKPCSPRLLEARLALRLLPSSESEITVGGLTVNSNTRSVFYCGKKISITSSEFNILWFLICRAGKFFDADTIYENIWEAPSLKQASIRYHISNLRRKLIDSTGKNLIITEFGKGYKFILS